VPFEIFVNSVAGMGCPIGLSERFLTELVSPSENKAGIFKEAASEKIKKVTFVCKNTVYTQMQECLVSF